MVIQIEQTFPRCDRCGRMIHGEAARIETTSAEGRAVVFCSEICRNEFAELFQLESLGQWTTGKQGATRSRRR
jgi:hypothetical protein